jgi:N-acetyl-anhydromuramyl-L-alanine amidase AmpD
MPLASTPQPAVGNALIINGEPVWVGSKVRTWGDHRMQWPAKNTRPRTEPPRVIVLHVTGGEGLVPQVHRTLMARGLSCDMIIPPDGIAHQMSDMGTTTTFHAGFMNNRSVGFEVVNYGFTRDPKLLAKWKPLREQYETTIHGRKFTMARSNNAQHAAVLAACDAVCQAFGIPRRLPRNADGSLRTDVMTREELADYSGVLCHYNLTPAKIDPGTDLPETLSLAGYG